MSLSKQAERHNAQRERHEQIDWEKRFLPWTLSFLFAREKHVGQKSKQKACPTMPYFSASVGNHFSNIEQHLPGCRRRDPCCIEQRYSDAET